MFVRKRTSSVHAITVNITVGVRMKGTLSPKILFELKLNINHYFKNNNLHIFQECFWAFSKDPDGCNTEDEMK